MKRGWGWAIGLLAFWGASSIASAAGIIQTDETVGPRQSLIGPNFAILESIVTRRGNNLFYSFSRIGIDNNEPATFTGDPSIRNVFSRVTGGNASRIDGT